jgi:hypothetical protein
MTDAAENFNRLAEHIDALEPDQVEHEISTMLEDGRMGESPIGRMIIRQSTDPDTDTEPLLTVLESVESAIERTGGDETRNALGSMAVEAMNRAFTDADFVPSSYLSVTQLMAQAERFAALQIDPYERVRALRDLSESLNQVDLSETNDIESSVCKRASDYLEEAGELVPRIQDPTDRFQAYKLLGQQAADNLHSASFELDAGAVVLADRLFEQPLTFFKEAMAASHDITDLHERAKLRSELVHSIAVGSPKVPPMAGIDAELFADLTDLALQETDAQLRDYREGDLSSMSPMDKTRGLSALGDQLATAVIRSYRGPSTQRDQLIEKTIEVFGATRDMAREISQPKPIYVATHEMSKTGHALKAAQNFAELDFEATKKLLAIGFDLAAIRDSMTSTANDKHPVYYVGRAADTASEIAMKSKDGAKALELFSLIHRLESNRVGEGNESMILDHNADHMLSLGIRLPLPGDKLELDEAGTELIEYIIRKADNTIGCLEKLPELQKLLVDYPALQQAIQYHLQGVAIDALAEQAPKSQTARLAREAAESLESL